MGTKDLPGGGEGIATSWHAALQLSATSSTEVEMGEISDDHGRRGDRDEEE